MNLLLSAFGGSVCVIAVQVLLIHLPAIASATETAKANEAPPLKTFQIYHSYTNNNEFKPRGTIQLIKEEDGSVTASVQNEDEEGSGSGSGSFLNDATFEGIDALVSSGGYYKLKIVDEESGASSMASVSGCDVRRANFRYVNVNVNVNMVYIEDVVNLNMVSNNQIMFEMLYVIIKQMQCRRLCIDSNTATIPMLTD